MTQPIPGSFSINQLHGNSDVDTSVTAQHHTLGTGQNQACSGAHTHNGKNSKLLGKGKNLAFPTTANAAYSQSQMQAVIDALRALGWGS